MARIITIGMGTVFVFSAAVQYNDPDPFRWATIYVIAAVLSFLSLGGIVPWWICAASSAVAITWAVVVGVGVDPVAYRNLFGDFGMASLEIEEAREALGLIIIGVWMGWLAGRSQRSSRHQDS